MKFTTPCEFEIPDTWWIETGMPNFKRQTTSYRVTPDPELHIIPLKEISPPYRNAGCDFDGHGFHRDRLVSILAGFVAGAAMPPVMVHERQPEGQSPKYALRDGFHRFYAAAAAGFNYLPATIVPYLDGFGS